jgi:hypothetical protein
MVSESEDVMDIAFLDEQWKIELFLTCVVHQRTLVEKGLRIRAISF